MNPKENAIKNELTGCLEWSGRIRKDGYGGCGHRGLAHRVSYEMNVGKIPDGMCVLHKCDNRKCVNPEHLWLGTDKDNVRDCIKKKRFIYNKVTFKGRKHSEETKKLMSKAHTGFRHSEESKMKMSLVNIGRKHTEEAKNKISLANSGMIRTEEAKLKMRVAKLGKPRGKYIIHKVWTEEEKRIRSEKVRQRRIGTKLINGKYVKI